jgi:hypothetical protein
MATPPTRLDSKIPITVNGLLPSIAFVQLFNAIISNLQAQVATNNQLLIQVQNTLALALQALQTAQNPPVPATTNGFGSAVIDVPEASGWVHGPTISLTGVPAGTLTANITLAGDGTPASFLTGGTVFDPSTGSSSAVGAFRIVEVIGGSETVVYTDAMTVAYYILAPSPVAYLAVTWDSAALAAWSAARVTTGAIDYRLDLMLSAPVGCEADNVVAYMFVNRA